MRWLAVIIIFFPSQFIYAGVSISEVAWMGSSASANHEWIELFNAGESVTVDGWILTDSNNLSITLAGSIPAGAYVVLERNRSDGGSVVGTPFLSYAGALVNTGATLTLRRADGTLVDQVAGGENWQTIGGDNTTKDTAQYTPNGWITAPPTPGRANATVASTPPPTTPTSQSATNVTRQVSGGSGLVAARTSTAPAIPEPLSLTIDVPQLVYVGQPVTFIVTPHGSGNVIRNSLVYEWNFGDLYTGTSSSPQHTYQYSGTYTVVVRGTFANTSALARQSVTVLPVTISVAHTANGDVLLHNDALYEIDISAYYLTGTKTKKIPKHTYVAPRETITVPWQMVSERAFPEVAVYGPSKALITTSSSGGHIAQPNNAGLNYTAAVTEPELFVPVVSQPLVTEVPVSTNGSPAFGFSSTALPLGTSTAEVVEGSTEDKALLPLALVSDTRSSDALPVAPTPWGIYGMFVLLLIGAVMGIFIRPQQTSKHESDLKI